MRNRTRIALVAVSAVAIAGAAVGADRASADTHKPAAKSATYEFPCTSCHYWTTASTTKTIDGLEVTLRAYAEHVVYSNGKDHVVNIAWAGLTDFGPLALDSVKANLRIARGGARITDTFTWDPAPRWDDLYVGRNPEPGKTNGRTAYGVDLVAVGSWRGETVRAVVTPSDMVDATPASLTALRVARTGGAK